VGLLSWGGWIFADACSVYVARANGLKYDKMETTGPNPKRGRNLMLKKRSLFNKTLENITDKSFSIQIESNQTYTRLGSSSYVRKTGNCEIN